MSRASSAEFLLTNNLSAEVSRASSAEFLLTNNLSAEVSRASSAEFLLTNNLSAEVSRASSAELALANDLSAEVSRATSAEASLTVRLSAEESRFVGTFDGTIQQSTLILTGDINAASFTTASDARLKKDVVEVSCALSIVSQIRPVFYNWIDERPTVNPGYKELGFIAQELEAVVPNVVATAPNGDLSDQKRVAYDRLVSLLVGAVKELKAEVDALKRA